jgi:hypothetical protein
VSVQNPHLEVGGKYYEIKVDNQKRKSLTLVKDDEGFLHKMEKYKFANFTESKMVKLDNGLYQINTKIDGK